MTHSKPPGLFYGYVVAAVSTLIMAVTWGTVYSFGVFLKPISSDLGWARADISFAYSLAFVVNGLLGIFAGRLCDRFGPRSVVISCGLLIALGYLLVSRMTALWQMYLLYPLVIGTGLSGIYVPAISTVARWFVRRRGLLTGVVIAGISAGMLITSPLATWLITSYGWRPAYIVMGVSVAVLVTVAALFLKRDPSALGLKAYGEDWVSSNGLGLNGGGLAFQQAVRTRQFWMLCLTLPSFEFAADTIMVHIVPHVTDVGISAIRAAGVLSIIGALSLAGRIGVGGIGDKIGNKRAFTICMSVALVSLISLLFIRQLWAFSAFAFVFGFAYGGYGPLLSLLVADLFGLKALGMTLGVVIFFVTIGATLGPLFAGKVFDITGRYQLAFIVSVALTAVAMTLSLFLRPFPGKK